jgi:5-methylcytosine-specific restriction enzyme A
MGLIKYDRHSAAVIRSKRWKVVRLEAKRRDGWACVECGAKGRLEVDHIKSVRDRPDLAYELTNLQTLCVRCHSRKTRIECGFPEKSPERKEWDALLKVKIT